MPSMTFARKLTARWCRWALRPAVAWLALSLVSSTASAAGIAWYAIKAPGPDGHDVEQASGLCFGQIGRRDGLWLACDRNGGRSAGRIYRIGSTALARAKHGAAVVADEEFVITPPEEGWPAFRQAHAGLTAAVLDDLQQRVEAGFDLAEGRRLDLEAITIAPAILPAGAPAGSPAEDKPDRQHLFVVAEEPYSLILELALGEPTPPANDAPQAATPASSPARLVAAYRYLESDEERGLDANDGLEGLTYAGSPGRFWWAEEGTRLHEPGANPRLFFSDPRLGRAQLRDGAVHIDTPTSDAVTLAVRRLRDGSAQTLNALCMIPDGTLLAVDRNGGWILRVDPREHTASRWLNLYDIRGTNLRHALAEFPAPRRMPYISIEGIAVDDRGDLWLVDDPAMPEGFRASCLVRVSGLPIGAGAARPPPATSSPAAR